MDVRIAAIPSGFFAVLFYSETVMPWVSVSGKNYCLIDPMLLIALVQKAAWGLRGKMHLDDCVPLRPEGSHWLFGLLDTS